MTTRAVLRKVEPGERADCTRCRNPIKFVAAKKLRQVIANVYKGKHWDRVEHYHADCYAEAGEPHGATPTLADRLQVNR